MYEPFFTTKGAGKGTGLGLSTVYAVVQSHSGAIEVTSRPGQGSWFQIFFPQTTPTLDDPQPRANGPVVSGRGRLALAAEDEPEVLRLTAGYLARAGFTVLTAKDGDEAARCLDERGAQIAVAVLDVVMPKQTGVAVWQRLRERGQRTPVVLVTGHDDEALGPAPHHEQVSVLRKPFAERELLARVARVMAAAADNES